MKLQFSEWKPQILSGSGRFLFLHGMGGTGALWRPVAAQLEDQWICTAPDQRGHGRSRPVPEAEAKSFLALDYAQDVFETFFTESSGSPKTWIVGHSMGARTTLALLHLIAQHHPAWISKIAGAICVDIGLQGAWGGGMGRPLADFLERLPESFSNRADLKSYLNQNCPDPSIAQYLSAVAKNSGGPQGPENWGFPFDHQAIIETIHQANSSAREALAQDSRAQGLSRLADWALQAVDAGIPVTFLRGQTSRVWSSVDFQKQKSQLESPLFQFQEWENCGHGLPFEQRVRFVSFLQSLEYSDPAR